MIDRDSLIEWLVDHGYVNEYTAEELVDHLLDDFELEWK